MSLSRYDRAYIAEGEVWSRKTVTHEARNRIAKTGIKW